MNNDEDTFMYYHRPNSCERVVNTRGSNLIANHEDHIAQSVGWGQWMRKPARLRDSLCCFQYLYYPFDTLSPMEIMVQMKNLSNETPASKIRNHK